MDAILKNKLVAILRGVAPDQLIPLLEALYAGGVRLAEITFDAENEPLAIKSLAFVPVEDVDTYAEYLAKQPADTSSQTAKTYIGRVEGEDSTLRSESSLYAKYDRSSPTTSPNSVTKTVLNYVGGETWKSTGQWIEWDFTVPEDGYYNITVKGRQN